MKKGKKSKSVFRQNGQEITVRKIEFSSPKERQEMLMSLAIGAQFGMRNRALYEYYGKEFIDYKLGHISQNANEFLRVLSAFMANCLEDDCPPSWQQCGRSFWEELIFTFYPFNMKLSPKQTETEEFLNQIKKYVRWLDKRVGTNWLPTVENLAEEALPELKICERLLNDIFLCSFPKLNDPDWNPIDDADKIEMEYAKCDEHHRSSFEVVCLIDETAVLTELETGKTYYLKGLPIHSVKPGLLISGVIGKRKREKTWTLYQTDGIFPNRGKAYLKQVLKTPLPAGSFC